MIPDAIKKALDTFAEKLRGLFTSSVTIDELTPVPVTQAERMVSFQPKGRVIRMSYRKKKSQQRNWSKWKSR